MSRKPRSHRYPLFGVLTAGAASFSGPPAMWFMMTHEDILRRTDLGWREKVVYPYLRTRQGEHAAAWPSLARIAADCGSTISSVRLALVALQRANLIEIIHRGRGRCSHYRILECVAQQHTSVRDSSTLPESKCAAGQQQVCRTAAPSVLQGSSNCAAGQHQIEKEKNKEKKREKNSTAPMLPGMTEDKKVRKTAPAIPSALDTAEFRFAWGLWKQHRIEIRKKLTPLSVQGQLKRCEAMGIDRAIAMIQYTITQGWTGLREPKGDNDGNDGRSTQGGERSAPRQASGASKARAEKASREFPERDAPPPRFS